MHEQQETPKDDEDKLILDPLEYMKSIDKEWAETFLDYSLKYRHFQSGFEIFYTSPRVVKIAILRPDSLARLLKNKYAEECRNDDPSCQNDQYLFKNALGFDLEQWEQPIEKSWPLWEVKYAIKSFRAGRSPMEAMQNIYADSENGEENDPIPASSPDMLGLILVIAGVAIIISAVMTLFGHK